MIALVLVSLNISISIIKYYILHSILKYFLSIKQPIVSLNVNRLEHDINDHLMWR